jgi:1,4-dihydroxy-2-naphthoate octaprenyltransferase
MNGKATVSRRAIWVDLLLYPGHTLPTALAPVLIGTGLALHDGVFAPLPLALAFLGSWLIHVGGVLTDNHELLRRHPRVPEHPELLAALADGSLRLPLLRLAIYATFALGILPGVYLVTIGGMPVVLIGTIGVVASLAYAGGPAPYAQRGFADPLFFLMFGVVAVVGTYYIQAAAHLGLDSFWLGARGALPLECFLVGLPVGALVTNVLIIDDIRDRDFDARKGWRTGVVRFGLGWSRNEFHALLVFAYLAPLAIWLLLGFSPFVLAAWLTLPEARRIARELVRANGAEELRPMTPRMAQLGMLYAGLLGLGLALPPLGQGP